MNVQELNDYMKQLLKEGKGDYEVTAECGYQHLGEPGKDFSPEVIDENKEVQLS